MGKLRKDVRMPPDLIEWIESLPPRYGVTFSDKARAALEIAREYMEIEQHQIAQVKHNLLADRTPQAR